MGKIKRPIQIVKYLGDIEKSPLSINQYFEKNDLPFKYATYYNYKKKFTQEGIDGLVDKRSKGNNSKFAKEIKTYVKGLLENKRESTSAEIQDKIEKEFNIDISIRTINRFRHENNLNLIRLPKNNNSWSESGGSEVIIALALKTGLIDIISEFIYRRVQNKKRTKQFRESVFLEKDHLNHRSTGKFTVKYNQLSIVRESKFKSLEEKINTKKFDSMEIFKLSKESIKRYSIALFSLPIATSNGRSLSVNNVNGNALKYLCGFNYKASTLDKHIRELKYLQLSNELIDLVSNFWFNFWRSKNKTNSIFACYYIDGNTKALWTPKRCHKGKVTMIGKVMNCIETLFIHDGQGHPIYFKTFNGHADLGKNGLKMMDKITDFLNVSTEAKDQFAVNRILIMDGGGNSVKILREITDYYYITILDNNQITDRKLKSVSDEKRYDNGDAYLIDCKIELKDSNEKNYVFETRAVQVKWDNGRTSTLVTNLPKKLFCSDNVVRSYFDRWPKQELDFKNMKNVLNIHRMVGYGKKLVDNPKVIEKIEQLQNKKNTLEEELEIPLSRIKNLEKKLHLLIRKETIYREKSIVIKGKRCFEDTREEQSFKDIQKQVYEINNRIKEIKNPQIKLFNSLKKKKDELARIIDKEKRYRVDVELDQLMTCFKISFANMCNYFFDECCGGEKISLQNLFENIFALRGKVKVENGQRHIFINQNLKQVEVMENLANGFENINRMGITDISGNIYKLSLV